MATSLPAKLKAAAPDVQRFARRAAELATLRPIVTYWCEYYILQQVLDRKLHTTDEECTAYAIELMDKLEAYKVANATNDAVVDDMAAKAYIENFGLETFARADNAQRNNTVSRQTADVFQAAATFLEILHIWGPLDAEISSKCKFAKYHALRIAKAIKAGEDPNATNPVVEPPPQPEPESEEALEAELKALEGNAGASSTAYRPPAVETVPDAELPHGGDLTQHESTGQEHEQHQQPSVSQSEHDVSPIEPSNAVQSRSGSVGGGYFPTVPSGVAAQDQPPSPPADVSVSDPAGFYNTAPTAPSHDRAEDYVVVPPPPAPAPQPLPTKAPVAAVPRAAPQTFASGPPPGGYNKDDDSMLAAQKHAKWAISALNFEDVDTAVKELRIALQALGAN